MFGLFASSRGSAAVSDSKNSKKEEPPPAGPDSNKYEEIDANFIHLFFDSETGEDYYHAMALGRLVLQDPRLSSFNFSLKVHSFGASISSGFATLTNTQCANANFANFLRPEVLEQIGSGDIVIAVGAQKMLKAFRDVASENSEAFFYFGTTMDWGGFEKDKYHFDLFAVPKSALNPDNIDDDDVFVIRHKTAFPFRLSLQELEQPVEHSPYDYNFVILPHIEVFSDFDKVIKSQMKAVFGSIGLQFLRGLNEHSKLVVLSGQNPAKLNPEKIKDRIHEELSTLINDFKNKKVLSHAEAQKFEALNRKMPVNFLHQDYISSNKIPQVLRRVVKSPNARIFLPFQSVSEILFLMENGVKPEQIFSFNYLKNEGLELGYMNLGEGNFEAVKLLAEFTEAELAEQKRKFPERMEFIKNIAEADANEIVIMYIEEVPHLTQEEKDELLEGEDDEELGEDQEEEMDDDDEDEEDDEKEEEEEQEVGQDEEKDKEEPDVGAAPEDELEGQGAEGEEPDEKGDFEPESEGEDVAESGGEDFEDVEDFVDEKFNEEARDNLENDLEPSMEQEDLNLEAAASMDDELHVDFGSMAGEPEEPHLGSSEEAAVEPEENHRFRDMLGKGEGEHERGR